MLVARGLSAAPPGAAAVVRDFDLELDAGDWLAIAGPNGAGKSTLLLTLAGLWPAAEGVVELNGRPLGPDAPAGRSGIAVVLQDPSGQLLQDSVADEIAFAARNLGRPESEIDANLVRLAARLGLQDELALDPRTLSAGRQQMVLLASALATAPAVLFSDEGGAHLDGEARSLVLETLREEVRRGLAVVWVTQEEEEQAAADRVLTLGAAGVAGAGPGRAATRGDAPPAARVADPGPRPEEAALEVSVDPWHGGRGPSIRVDRPMVVPIGSRGVIAVEGRNGTGKSVLLEAIAGVNEIAQVRVAWKRRPDHPPILAAQYPDHQIFAERVEEEVLFAVSARGGDREAARKAAVFHFEALELGGAAFLERRTWNLSAAEKRMLQIVAALVTPASLVLLDEPTCGLDPDRRRRLSGLVGGRGRTVPVVVAGQDHGWHETLGADRLELAAWKASASVKTD